MTRAAFNSYGAVGNLVLSTGNPQSGSSDLAAGPTDGTLAAEILAQSEQDSPTEAFQIVGEFRAGNAQSPWFYVFFRWQDVDNHYCACVTGGQTNGFTSPDFRFYKKVGGAITQLSAQAFGNDCGNLNQCISLESGNPTNWNPLRITAWVDHGGDFRCRLEEDSNRDGTWTQLRNDAVDPAPDLPDGGGLGVGAGELVGESNSAGAAHYDETEFYYQ